MHFVRQRPTPPLPLPTFSNPPKATARDEWVQETVAYAIDQGLDGMNIDYEGHKPSLTAGFNEVVVELCDAMHAAIPNSEVSIDVPFYPEYEGRNFDYMRIAKACDGLFIMAYDGEFWDNIQCVVTNATCSQACAPLDMVEQGIQQYLERDVDASKLYLGLPWYGLKYESFGKNGFSKIPFFAGQIDYQDILAAVDKAGESGSVTMDEKSSTRVFDCGGLCSQWSDLITDRTDHIWFDDPEVSCPRQHWPEIGLVSPPTAYRIVCDACQRYTHIGHPCPLLKLPPSPVPFADPPNPYFALAFSPLQTLAPKYALASKYGLKGVGMWESTKVTYDPEAHTPDADDMWGSLCQRSE